MLPGVLEKIIKAEFLIIRSSSVAYIAGSLRPWRETFLTTDTTFTQRS